MYVPKHLCGDPAPTITETAFLVTNASADATDGEEQFLIKRWHRQIVREPQFVLLLIYIPSSCNSGYRWFFWEGVRFEVPIRSAWVTELRACPRLL